VSIAAGVKGEAVERMRERTIGASAVATQASWPPPVPRRLDRATDAVLRVENWLELVKFCAVGASGYVVNLVVYTILLHGAGLHYLLAAACSFVAAVTNNYWWNRHWTFRAGHARIYAQGSRFLAVSAVTLCANLLVLHVLIGLGVEKVLAQAVAIVLVMPLNFFGSKLWAFRGSRPVIDD
jgi:putative flippase GtrA